MTQAQTGDMIQSPVSPADVMVAAQLACLLEVSAPKPGNVSPGRHFRDTRYEDFLASAAALGAPLARAGEQPLGTTVRLAVEATRRWSSRNTNLGIVLLLTPLARAALRSPEFRGEDASVESRIPNPEPRPAGRLRTALRRVLDETTIEDARDIYAAIRMASPGGLGHAEAQDVAGEPGVALLEAMRLAAHRDGIAREYVTAFEVTFGTGVPALERARFDRLSWDDAVVETFLTLLAANIDTHVARRGGVALAADVSERARLAIARGGVCTETGRMAIVGMDRAIRDAGNIGNPGTTADLTAAAIFVLLLCGGWNRQSDGESGRERR